jgi:hypothetical protein
MNQFRSLLFLLVASLFTLVVAPRVFADSTDVSVIVNGYAGRWTLDGTNRFIGDQNITLDSGTYTFQLSNVDENYFQFTVDDSGNVTVSDPAVATGGVGTLTLHTHAVAVDVSGYAGRWRSGADVGISTTRYRENQTIYLAATTYSFGLINVVDDYFQYTVDTSGNVTVSDTAVATGGPGTLTLITHAVDVNVSGYIGRWRSGADNEISTSRYRENQTIYLAATTYSFSLINVANDYFQYEVDTGGNVTVSDTAVASGGPGMLTLITHAVNVNMNNYAGRWRSGADVGISTTRYRENQTIYLAAATYSFSLINVANDYFQYAVDTSGDVTVSDTAVANGGPGMLTLITHAVAVDMSGYAGRWRSGVDVVSVTRYSGNQTVYLAAATYPFALVNVTPTLFEYAVDTGGNVAVSDNHKAIAGANTLTLVTRAIDFDLDGAPGNWFFGDKTPRLNGNQTLCLAPATYTFSMAGNQFDYTVDNSISFYLFTVSPNAAPITIDGTNYTVMLSLGPAGSGCFDLFPSAWDDLERAIAAADIDVEGIRQSLQAKAAAARAAYERGEPVTAGNILCALLNEVDAQSGIHIDPASAENIRDTAVNIALALGIPLKCI